LTIGKKSLVNQYYNEKCATYDDEERLLYFKVYDHITWRYTKPFIPKHTNAKVLDAAGGTGKWSVPIAREGPHVVLADLSDGMLDVAREKIAEAGLNGRIEIHQTDITTLDFEDETFDMVFCDHALCFVEDTERAVHELTRVLKRDSPIVISAQNRYPLSLSILADDFEKGMRILHGEEHFMMQGRVPVHTLGPQEFRVLLESKGVQIREMVGKGIVLTPLVLPVERFWTANYDQAFADDVTKMELDLCERSDALPLAGHIQAIGYKS